MLVLFRQSLMMTVSWVPCLLSVLAAAVQTWNPLPSLERWVAQGILKLSEFTASGPTVLEQFWQRVSVVCWTGVSPPAALMDVAIACVYSFCINSSFSSVCRGL